MEQIVVKTEVQSNGEILLYYVDENGESQEGVLTAIENADNDIVPMEDNSYILSNFDDMEEEEALEAPVEEIIYPWADEDTKRLLMFYNDNKTSFVSGLYVPKQLWAVACKTMLIGKTPEMCELKLEELKQKYCEVCGFIKQGIYVKWPFISLCHRAFHENASVTVVKADPPATATPTKPDTEPKFTVTEQDTTKKKENDGILSIKHINPKSPDENVEKMLNLYLKYKESFQKEHWRRDLWDKIAQEMRENDSEYLHKKFLNHKQHYINLLIQKKEGNSNITWPYMDLFDKIYGDDAAFHKKHFNINIKPVEDYTVREHEWYDVEMIFLAKYYYDCYDEFQDTTIPNKFLWTEVGRLLEKQPETCEIKYKSLRTEHLDNVINTNYSIISRIPISIIFDCIIAKDVKNELSECNTESHDAWWNREVDELVQFFYDKIELFKDPECHFVCWAAAAHKFKKTIGRCKKIWDELVELYKTILNDKKENSDLQIDWRYIDLFDRIFDYGMDTNLLKGYKISQNQPQKSVGKVAVKKIVLEADDKDNIKDNQKADKDDPDFIMPNFTGPRTDPRSSKILEFYLKNKDKFQVVRNKLTAWEPLCKQISLTTTQCAHRFKTLKQTYIEYVKKELDNPRAPVTWPYYTLCKKVFGYRLIKAKLKEGLDRVVDTDEWLAREIKLLISFFSKNFHDISNNIEDVTKWTPLASQLGKSEICCKEKFVELRKCYRKLTTMRNRNPDVKISWSYFNMFDRIYRMRQGETMVVEVLEDKHHPEEEVQQMEQEEAGEDDYQCIIVLQEGQELPSDISNAQIIIQQPHEENNAEIGNTQIIQPIQYNVTETENTTTAKPAKWTKRTKKRLLISYINYIRSHRGQEIKPQEMWAEIATKFPGKKPINCRKMLLKMKNNFKQAEETSRSNNPLASLLTKVLKLKPKFIKSDPSKEQKVYKDVPMDSEKVNLALAYYLEHIEEFVNPKFEKKYLWTQLANHVSEPVTKIYNKINYLKQAYNIETEEIAGQVTEFSALLKEIISKEVAVTIVLDVNQNPQYDDQEATWTDDEIEQLMIWYLSNLDMFKNPKFNKSYLWMEASTILCKSPVVCSKKMIEIRTLYRNMVKENTEGLKDWRFFGLCQKIYGTGKKNSAVADNL